MTTKVFVYGTLLRGEPNNGLLATARFMGQARTTRPFTMFDMGKFPGVVVEATCAIEGEVYDVDAETLARLDLLEGHPNFYERKQVLVCQPARDGSEAFYFAFMYILPPDFGRIPGRDIIRSGSWREHLKQEQQKESRP